MLSRLPHTRSWVRVTLTAAGVLIIIVIFMLGWHLQAEAQGSWYVAPNGNDQNDCRSRDTACATIGVAIGKAPAGDTINIAAGTYVETLFVRKDLVFQGAGADVTVLDGGGGAAVFGLFDANSTTTIADVTIQGGRSVGSGGGITNYGTLTLANSMVRDNGVTLGGGFQGLGGGIANFGTLVLTDSSVISNTAYVGGGIFNSGKLMAINSTISGNVARRSGGGIANGNFGVFAPPRVAEATLNNVTLAGNTAGSDGDGTGVGGGIANDVGSAVNVQNTLLAANAEGRNQTAAECSGTLTSSGYNLIQVPVNCRIDGNSTGVITERDPRLGLLQDNGGTTFTQALLAGSPAIDAGNPTTCADTDQRGVARPQGPACDIGAYEFIDSTPPTPTPDPYPYPYQFPIIEQ